MQAIPPTTGGHGTSTPSPNELLQVVIGSTSQDPVTMKANDGRLKEMVQLPGVLVLLYEFAVQRELPVPVRLQCILQFKNNAVSQWRSRRLFTSDDRMRIRACSLQLLDEGDEAMGNVNSFNVSKIARQDYPKEWPELPTILLNCLQENFQKRFGASSDDRLVILRLRRSLQMLNGVLKELTAIKMPAGVKATATLFELLSSHIKTWLGELNNYLLPRLTPQGIQSPRLQEDLICLRLTNKCLIRLCLWLWPRSDKALNQNYAIYWEWLVEVFNGYTSLLPGLIETRQRILVSGTVMSDFTTQHCIRLFTNYIIHIGKFFRRLSQVSHQRFVSLPKCDDLLYFYWGQITAAAQSRELMHEADDAPYSTKILVQGLLLFKENMAQLAPSHKSSGASFLTVDFVREAVKVLVAKFLILRERDLVNWSDDPEEWCSTEDVDEDQWEWDIRHASERVLMAFARAFSDLVAPDVLAMLEERKAQPCYTLDDYVQKEAVYTALGRCCHQLQLRMDFSQEVQSTFSNDVQDNNPNARIIKRRIAWVIGLWVSADCTSPNNGSIWNIFLSLLRDRSDVAVQLSAVTALRYCMDYLHFDVSIFSNFLPDVLRELLELLGSVSLLDSRRQIVKTLDVFINQTESMITPYVDMFIALLPGLWNAAETDWTFKGELLSVMKNIIKATKEQSTALGHVVVPLIREGMSDQAKTFLDVDAFDLWEVALKHTTTIESVNGAPALIELFPLAIYSLNSNFDMLGKVTTIVESYFLLAGVGILQRHAHDVFSAFTSALNTCEVMINTKDMVLALNILLQITTSSLWGEPLHTSGLFPFILNRLLEEKEQTLVLIEFIHLLSRILIADRQMFSNLMSAAAGSLNQPESSLYHKLLDVWWAKFDNMSEPRSRKLTAMGIASMVPIARPEILERVPTEIFNLLLDVFGEIKEAALQNEQDVASSPISPNNLRRHWELNDAPPEFFGDTLGSAEYGRRRAVYDVDPVRTVRLNAFVAEQFQAAENVIGSENFQRLCLSTADPTVLKQIQDELLPRI